MELKHRDIFGDNYVIAENRDDPKKNCYNKRAPLRDYDIVLDIGAHIGAYTCFAAKHCQRVIAVEPEQINFDLLSANTQTLENVEVVHAAVVPDDYSSDTVDLYVNVKENTGAHRIAPTRGRPVQKVHVLRISKALQNVTYVKIDCEGSEYNILREPLPQHVEVVVGEVHLTKPYSLTHAFKLMHALSTQGFVVVFKPSTAMSFTRYFSAQRRPLNR